MWVQAWTYLLKHSDKILEWTLQHLYIILVANACAVAYPELSGARELNQVRAARWGARETYCAS